MDMSDPSRESQTAGRGSRLFGLFALLLAAGALAAGLWFRLSHVFTDPLWLDEAYSAFAADRGLRFIWTVTPLYETHPPFYYSLLSLWCDLFGGTVPARRALGVLCGIGALPILAAAAAGLARLMGMARADARWLVCAAVTLAAVHPLMIEMTHQVRPYPVMALVYATATLALVRLLADTKAERAPSRRWLATWFVAQALMMWLHDLGVLFGVAMTLALACTVLRPGLTRKDWAWLVIGQGLVGILYVPALLITLSQAKTWTQSGWAQLEWATLPTNVATIYTTWNLLVRVLTALAAVAAVLLLARRRMGGRAVAALLLMALLPTLLSITLSALVRPVFVERTLSAATIPGVLMIAAGLSWPGRWRWLAAPVLLMMTVSAAANDRVLIGGLPHQDWYGTVRWLAARVRPGDVVWAYPNEGALPLDAALRDMRQPLSVRPIPAPVPALHDGGYYPAGNHGSVSLYPQEIAALMQRPDTKAPPTIWLLRLYAKGYDKGDAMVHALERDRTIVDRWQPRAIDVIGLRRRDLPPVAPPQQP
jgi:hypothetical protein